jgi:hypothetical protein
MRLGETSKKLQLIATSDVGFFGAHAFLHADSAEYKNRSMSLAGDELTFSEMKAVFEKETGEKLPTTYAFLAGLIQWMSKDFGYMMKWFRTDGFGVDVADVKRRKGDVKDFGTWLETESAWKKI